MLREKAVKFAKVMFTGLMLSFGMTVLAPASPVEAEILEESEPNDNPATADVLPLNTWIKGETPYNSYSDEDWYTFTILQGGASQVEILPTEDNTYGSKWEVAILDENRHELSHFTGNSVKSYVLGLAPGRYYIKVERWSNNGTYNLRVRYTMSEQWEKEQYYGNKSLSNANTAYVNNIYTGVMYCSNDVDYYRFKLNGTNKVSVKFNIDDTVSNPGRWRIEFIEYNSRKSLGNRTLSTNETLTVPSCSGDLIVKVESWSGAAGDIYHLQAFSESLDAGKPGTGGSTSGSSGTTGTIVSKPASTSITSIKAGKQKATIYWKKASNATGYYLYRSTSANGTYKKIATVTGKTSYTDKKSLKSKQTYYYKVISFRKSGSKVLRSKASPYKKVKIK